MKKIIFIFLAVLFLFSCERNDMFDFSNSGSTKLQIKPGDGQLILSWDVLNVAATYEVWYNTSNDPDLATQSGGEILIASETITGLSNGTLYYVWLKVKYNSGGLVKIVSSGTGIPMAIPAPPLPSINPSTPLQFSLNWAPMPGADSYQIWYGATNVLGDAIQVGGDITGSGYPITGLSSNTTYYVWMTSKNAAGTSTFSTMVSGTTLP